MTRGKYEFPRFPVRSGIRVRRVSRMRRSVRARVPQGEVGYFRALSAGRSRVFRYELHRRDRQSDPGEPVLIQEYENVPGRNHSDGRIRGIPGSAHRLI